MPQIKAPLRGLQLIVCSLQAFFPFLKLLLTSAPVLYPLSRCAPEPWRVQLVGSSFSPDIFPTAADPYH